MRIFGLIGYPLSHSFSKKYFTEKFLSEGINGCQYDLFPIEDITLLPALIAAHPQLEGLNVTIPYKEKVIPFLDNCSDVVKAINACNCITVRRGELIGHNTDVVGFEHTLKMQLKPHHKKALVLGTGGAAKAVHYVLQKNGISYVEVSRTKRGNNLVYEEITEDLLQEFKLVINTSPLGMYPDVNSAPLLPYNAISNQHLFIDLIYNPAKTLFLQKAEERGAFIQNGGDMLLVQAEESWKIWNQPL
jgi:shikimate dehydrogenase